MKVFNTISIVILLSCTKKEIEKNENFTLNRKTVITEDLQKIEEKQQEKAVITDYNAKNITIKPNDYTNTSIAINLDEIGSDIITPKLNEELNLDQLFQVPPLENITKEYESIQNLAESNIPNIPTILQTSESNSTIENTDSAPTKHIASNDAPPITNEIIETTNERINFNEIKNQNSFSLMPEIDVKKTTQYLDNIVNDHRINTLKNAEHSEPEATILTNAKEIAPNVYKVINKDGTITIVIIK